MPPGNTILQLSAPYTDYILSNSPNLEIVRICYISLSWSRGHFVYVDMGEPKILNIKYLWESVVVRVIIN